MRCFKPSLQTILCFLSGLFLVGCGALDMPGLSTLSQRVESSEPTECFDPHNWLHQVGGTGTQRGVAIARSSDKLSIFAVGVTQSSSAASIKISTADPDPTSTTCPYPVLEHQVDLQNGSEDSFFVVQYDLSGKLKWHKILGSYPSGNIHDISVDQDDNIYLAGEFSQRLYIGKTMIEGKGYKSAFLAKFNAKGEPLLVWVIRGDGASNNTLRAVKVNRTGKDAWLTFINEDGNKENRDAFFVTGFATKGAELIEIDFYFSGKLFPVTTIKDTGLFVAKFTKNESFSFLSPLRYTLWHHSVANADGYDVTFDQQGVFVCGDFFGSFQAGAINITSPSNTSDGLVARLSQDGTWSWLTTTGSSGMARCVSVDYKRDTKEVVATGYFKGTMSKFVEDGLANEQKTIASLSDSTDVYRAHYKPDDGTVTGLKTSGSHKEDKPTDMFIEGGNIYIVGYYKDQFYADTQDIKSKPDLHYCPSSQEPCDTQKGGYHGFLIKQSSTAVITRVFGDGNEIPMGVTYAYGGSQALMLGEGVFVTGFFQQDLQIYNPILAIGRDIESFQYKTSLTATHSTDMFIWRNDNTPTTGRPGREGSSEQYGSR